jgi:hypothetical protein
MELVARGFSERFGLDGSHWGGVGGEQGIGFEVEAALLAERELVQGSYAACTPSTASSRCIS